ncbi:hypothetical protein DM01DRAFT_1334491 [Hesseltinella vesiculosa]|uniref:BZIP domain-containing protein n=1 Tax=Hesseltinella vesiculosa TaxID=101127 RepID=A0A1X2GM36_9FUNG|nr:hypothetical protein DM01DRAFT_1334491 [Hesseltinella vesiculosa]
MAHSTTVGSSPELVMVKEEPMQEDDDVVLSYLNEDYVSNDLTTPPANDMPSPPYSTSSATTTCASTSPTAEPLKTDPETLLAQDPLFSHWQQVLSEQPLPWPASTAALPTMANHSPPMDLGQDSLQSMNIHPLMMPPAMPFFPSGSALPLLPPALPYSTSPPPSRSLSTCSAFNDDHQPKKKRNSSIKKRDIAPAPLKPLAPIKSEEPSSPSSSPTIPILITSLDNTLTPDPSHPPEKSAAELAYAKRQERLIKNRAAALLSRKRKRDHLTSLEQERQNLIADNDALVSKVAQLETRVLSLEQENLELKRKLALPVKVSPTPSSLATPKHAKTTGMVFMIILFSFALFTLPSSHMHDQLTVGGSSVTMPLIESSLPNPTLDQMPATTTDLVLINPVRPGDLQTWIESSMEQNKSTDLVQWHNNPSIHPQQHDPDTPPHLYLYAKELSQVALSGSPLLQPDPDSTLSLLCPVNTSAHCDSYLQIDVKVLGSRMMHGQLQSPSSQPGHPKSRDPAHPAHPAHDDQMKSLRRKWSDKRKRVARVVL